MVVKKPVVKKRKSKKGKTTKNITKSGKGGNVSQVVNVYVSKATRQRRAKPVRIQPQIQPQMYNAGQDYILSGIREQNKTLMDILNKQRIADTTPNSDIQSLDNLVVKKLQSTTPEPSVKNMDEVDYGGIAPVNPKYLPKPKPKNVNIDTTSRENVSNMLSSIAEGMDEIPQSNEIKNRILAIGDQVRPLPQELTGIRVRIAEIDDLDEKNQLENEFYKLRTQLQEQKRFDDSIKMSAYRDLPKKVSTLRLKVAQMRNKLNQSQRLTADEV
jgi:hypothetical protein